MYYNSNSNDYYSAYKEEIGNAGQYQGNALNKIVKPGLIILGLGLFALSAFYFFNHFSTKIKDKESVVAPSTIAQTTDVNTQKGEHSTVELSKNILPNSIQLKKSSTTQTIAQSKEVRNEDSIKETIRSVTGSSNINPKDIERIVKIIMTKMNNAPKEKAVTQTASLEEQLAAAEKEVVKKQTLKESNHYNKVIVSSDNTATDTSNKLMQLQNALNNALEENSEKSVSSDYSKAISKEVNVRSNEMRVIIVQKGDTLSKIAKRAYGNYDDYVKIFKANPEVVKNPDEIFVGQRLRIPS